MSLFGATLQQKFAVLKPFAYEYLTTHDLQQRAQRDANFNALKVQNWFVCHFLPPQYLSMLGQTIHWNRQSQLVSRSKCNCVALFSTFLLSSCLHSFRGMDIWAMERHPLEYEILYTNVFLRSVTMFRCCTKQRFYLIRAILESPRPPQHKIDAHYLLFEIFWF